MSAVLRRELLQQSLCCQRHLAWQISGKTSLLSVADMSAPHCEVDCPQRAVPTSRKKKKVTNFVSACVVFL